MSSESLATTKKRASASPPKRTPEDDHRRKRRNRPTQSCLNCHTSKRMCDRQRPCGRCTQLGLTGLCVYEVDNPSQRVNASDEAGRLKKRVAELESIIRELKNKPHPRWAHPGQPAADNDQEDCSMANDLGKANSPRATSPSSSKSPRARASSSASSFLDVPPPPSSSGSSGMGSPSPLHTPCPGTPPSPVDIYLQSEGDAMTSLLSSDYDFSSLLSSYQSSGGPGVDDSSFGNSLDALSPLSPPPETCASHQYDEHCGCLHDHTSYNTVLELSLRLRRAAEILSRYAKHTPRSECKVHKRISDLDKFTTSALGNVVSPPEPPSPHGQVRGNGTIATNAVFGRPAYAAGRSAVSASPTSLAPQALQSPRAWDFKYPQTSPYPSPLWEDSFMSWEPIRHQS